MQTACRGFGFGHAVIWISQLRHILDQQALKLVAKIIKDISKLRRGWHSLDVVTSKVNKAANSLYDAIINDEQDP